MCINQQTSNQRKYLMKLSISKSLVTSLVSTTMAACVEVATSVNNNPIAKKLSLLSNMGKTPFPVFNADKDTDDVKERAYSITTTDTSYEFEVKDEFISDLYSTYLKHSIKTINPLLDILNIGKNLNDEMESLINTKWTESSEHYFGKLVLTTNTLDGELVHKASSFSSTTVYSVTVREKGKSNLSIPKETVLEIILGTFDNKTKGTIYSPNVLLAIASMYK